MTWQTQGRQFHQWFGHGTSGVEAPEGVRALGPEDVAAVVAAGAAVSMGGGLRAEYERYLAGGGLEALTRALPLWAGASGLDAGAFRSLAVGAGCRLDAGALQDVGRLVRDARGVGDLQAASARLAEVVESGGASWRFGLRYARDQAGYCSVRGVLPGLGEGGAGGGFLVAASGLAGISSEAGVGVAGGVGAVGSVLRSLGPWGLVAGVVLGVGAAGYLYWTGRQGEVSGPMEARPPVGPGSAGEPPDVGSGPGGPARPNISPSAGTGSPSPDEDPEKGKPPNWHQTVEEAFKKLNGMSRADFGRLVGFEQGVSASARGATEASAELVARVKAAGVSREALVAIRDVYQVAANGIKRNITAEQRVALLNSILRRY